MYICIVKHCQYAILVACVTHVNIFIFRWRIVIHGGIDGFSRLVVFMAASDNNGQETVLYNTSSVLVLTTVYRRVLESTTAEKTMQFVRWWKCFEEQNTMLHWGVQACTSSALKDFGAICWTARRMCSTSCFTIWRKTIFYTVMTNVSCGLCIMYFCRE